MAHLASEIRREGDCLRQEQQSRQRLALVDVSHRCTEVLDMFLLLRDETIRLGVADECLRGIQL